MSTPNILRGAKRCTAARVITPSLQPISRHRLPRNHRRSNTCDHTKTHLTMQHHRLCSDTASALPCRVEICAELCQKLQKVSEYLLGCVHGGLPELKISNMNNVT